MKKEIDQENAAFWNELCGSNMAKHHNITDTSPASIKKYDDAYFAYYPYLSDWIPFKDTKSKDVLEIGLGFGTVAQKLSESGARYTGLDIAAGPVEMVNYRFSRAGLAGGARQGSILDPPFPHESFDFIVAIGCLHHTGNMQLAINNCHNLLRPGGLLIFMVYYAYSYRRFFNNFRATATYLHSEMRGHRGIVGENKDHERRSYDADSAGNSAPYTDWISAKSLKVYCRLFSDFKAGTENINREFPFSFLSRQNLMKTPLPHLFGLDLYARAKK